MSHFEESLHRANEFLEEYKRRQGGEGREHLHERSLAACADAIETLEAEGRATPGLVKAGEEIRQTGRSSLRVEEIIRRLRQASQLAPPPEEQESEPVD